MAKHKYKRKIFNYRVKKVTAAIVIFAFLFILGLWWTADNFRYDTQVALRTEEILTALGSRNCVQLVKPKEDTTVIKGELSLPIHGVDNCYLVILVSSLPSNEFRRNIIRNTWAKKEHTKETIVRFFMGKPKSPEEMKILELESQLHGDIIVDDFEEHYYRLTMKSLRLLKWFIQNKTPGTQFVVKTDDDVFVNIENAISYLKQNVSATECNSYIGGSLYLKSPVEKDPYSKWFVPRQMMMWGGEDIYPPFVGGPFYLMHAEIAAKLIEQCEAVPLFHLEDVYITGLLGSYYLKIIPKNISTVYSTVPKAYWPTIHYYYVKFILDTKPIIAYHTYSTEGLIQVIYQLSTTTT